MHCPFDGCSVKEVWSKIKSHKEKCEHGKKQQVQIECQREKEEVQEILDKRRRQLELEEVEEMRRRSSYNFISGFGQSSSDEPRRPAAGRAEPGTYGGTCLP